LPFAVHWIYLQSDSPKKQGPLGLRWVGAKPSASPIKFHKIVVSSVSDIWRIARWCQPKRWREGRSESWGLGRSLPHSRVPHTFPVFEWVGERDTE